MRYFGIFLILIAVAKAGVWGSPRAYVITEATEADRHFVSAALGVIAQKHELKDRLAWVSDVWTFAYYTGDAGTVQARKDGSRVIIDAIFLAKDQALAVQIDRVLAAELTTRFGDRVQSSPRAEKKPNQSLEPTTMLGTSAAEQPLVPSIVVAHL